MKKLVITAAALVCLLAALGCVSNKQVTHQKMQAIHAKYSGVNIDSWAPADRAEFKRLLAIETK